MVVNEHRQGKFSELLHIVQQLLFLSAPQDWIWSDAKINL